MGKIGKQDLLRELSNCVGYSCVFLSPLTVFRGSNIKRLLKVHDEHEVDEVFFFDEEFRPVRHLMEFEKNAWIYCFNNGSSDALQAFLLAKEFFDFIDFFVQK